MFRYTPFDMSPWSVLDELMDVDRRVDRALQASADKANGKFPRANIYANDAGAVVDIAVPGVPHDAIEVSVDGKVLKISGKVVSKEKDKEPGEFSFERSVELPFRISDGGSKAVFNNGMLRITLPKAEEAKPRRIAITNG